MQRRSLYSWRRLVRWLPALVLSGWLAGAAGLWLFLKYQRDFKSASYAVLVCPWRWPRHRTALGRHYLDLANQEWKQKHYPQALLHLQAGVNRLPADTRSTRLLADIYFGMGRRDLALHTLMDGLAFGRNDFDYLRLLFNLLFQGQEDDRVVGLAGKLLPDKADDEIVHRFIALEAATAHYHRGRYDQAERLIADWNLAQTDEGGLLLAKSDWERGYPDLALCRLEHQVALSPKCDELYLQLVRCYHELGRNDEARQQALLRQFNAPTSPGPRLDLIYAYHGSDEPAAGREIEAYLADFAGNPGALALLAWFGVDSENPGLVRRVQSLASTHHFPLTTFNLALVQAELGAQHYQAALAIADAALRTESGPLPHPQSLVAGLRAVALFGLHDNQRGQLQLDAFLHGTNLRVVPVLPLAKQLCSIGAKDAALRVLAAAIAADDLNQAALGELIRLDTELGNRAAVVRNIPRLLAMRKPSRAVLEEALLVLNHPEDAELRRKIGATLARVTSSPAPEM